MSRVLARDFLLEAGRDRIAKHRILFAMGEYENGGTTAGGEDVCRWADVSGPARLYTPNAAGEQFTVVSSSANDTNSGGSGVRTLRLHYIDASGVEQTEDIALNGNAPVNTVATNIRFVNDMHALTVGSDGVAVGNISVYKTGSTIGATLTQMIAAGGNKSLVPHRMVPAGHKLYLMGWHAEEANNKRAAFRLRSTDFAGTLISGVFCFKAEAYLNGSATGELQLPAIEVPALSIVKISHWDGATQSEGSASWWGYLVQD